MDILFRIRGGLDLAFQLAATDGVFIRILHDPLKEHEICIEKNQPATPELIISLLTPPELRISPLVS